MFEKNKTVVEWAINNPIDTRPDRTLVNMAIIDDDGFDTDKLTKRGYSKIRVITKPEHIDDFIPYNVILCDINGVNFSNDENASGIDVARSIKKDHPDKIVIQFSGVNPHEYDQQFSFNNYMLLDGYINKNQSSSALVQELDDICSILWNPIKAWDHLEKTFRKMKISNYKIGYLEHLYVKSLEKKKNLFKLLIKKLSIRTLYLQQ